jgi:hypothetical protein
MATHQLTLLAVKEAVRCVICGCALATLDEMRERSCRGGKVHQVDRAEYFRLYRLSIGAKDESIQR